MEETTKGTKKDIGKPRMDLIPARTLEDLAKVFTLGADKYDEGPEVYKNNWRKGMRWGRVRASLMRHLTAWWGGEEFDPESGLLHLAHVLANATMLHEYYYIFPEGDDRPLDWRNKKRIGIDLDGVLVDLYPHIANNGMPHYQFGTTEIGILQSMVRGDWINLPAVIAGEDLPFEPVVYVTVRNDVGYHAADFWLKKNSFPFAPVRQAKDGAEKAEILKEHEVDIYIDDNFEYFKAINKAGIYCYLFDQPYNRKHDVGSYRISSLHEVLNRRGNETTD